MKKLLLTLALGLLSVSAFAQGTITFNNDATSLVTTNNQQGGIGTATTARVILLYSTATLAPVAPSIENFYSLAGWTQTTPTTADAVGVPLPGRFAGGTQTADDAAGGSSPWVVVVGWSGTFSTLAEAMNAGALVGASGVWAQPTGSPPTLPAQSMITGVAGFSGLELQPIPEPTTIALGLLGAGSLLFLRRKK